MKPVLVTGATGFIGWHVARLLRERGRQVRCLVRPQSKLRELDAETVTGDLTDAASLDRAAAGCSEIYHVAADYRLWARDPAELYRNNVDGTANMLQAARRAGAERFVYTSTVGCIAVGGDAPGDESATPAFDDVKGAYKRSKLLAERKAIEEAASGLPVVIVNPTAPIGDHDFKPTPTGRIIVDFLRGKMPAYIDTGLNFVDVAAVARGHLLAAERGRAGERYILGGQNLTLCDALNRLSRITGRPTPRVRIPWSLAYGVAIVEAGIARLTGREPQATLDGVQMARKKMWVRHDKAARELGYEAGCVEGAFERAVSWFRAHGYC